MLFPLPRDKTGRPRARKSPGIGKLQLAFAVSVSDSGPQDQGCVALRLVAWPGWDWMDPDLTTTTTTTT